MAGCNEQHWHVAKMTGKCFSGCEKHVSSLLLTWWHADQILLRSPSAAPLQRPSSAASTREASPAAPEPQASEDTAAGEAAADSHRASLRIRLRGSGPRKRYGDESPTQGRHTPWSKLSQAQGSDQLEIRQSGQSNRRDSASPAASQKAGGDAGIEAPRQSDDGAQSGRPRQTRLRVKPLALAD